MKILLMLSVREKDNPYSRLLVQSLETEGMEVHLPHSKGFYLWRSFRASRPDVIHLQWQHHSFVGGSLLGSIKRSSEFFLQFFGLRLLGTPFVWTVHNIGNHEKRMARWELAMCRLLARSAPILIVHCQAAVPAVAAAYRISPERIRVVPHGHYRDAYPPARTRRAARERLGVEQGARVFLVFGHIRRYKGIGPLLSAFRHLASDEVRLIIVGQPRKDSFAQELQIQAAKDARVTTRFEFIPDDQLADYISACDLVVLPYRDSLTSGAAILAATYGKAVLAPRLGCMQEFPPDAMISFDPDTVGSLEAALELSLNAPLDAMGEATQTYINAFPWSLVAARTMDIYREVSGDDA